MSAPLLIRSPTCLVCLRRLAFPQVPRHPIQVRGKKTFRLREDNAVPVRLLKDVHKYGIKGMASRPPKLAPANPLSPPPGLPSTRLRHLRLPRPHAQQVVSAEQSRVHDGGSLRGAGPDPG